MAVVRNCRGHCRSMTREHIAPGTIRAEERVGPILDRARPGRRASGSLSCPRRLPCVERSRPPIVAEPLRLDRGEEFRSVDEARSQAFRNQRIAAARTPEKRACRGVPAEHMTGTKDDDACRQIIHARQDVVLDLRDTRIVEMDSKGADDADKSGLRSPCNLRGTRPARGVRASVRRGLMNRIRLSRGRVRSCSLVSSAKTHP